MRKIGFIGLGNMGKGMSINLSKENLEIIGYDINDNAYKNLQDNKILIANNLNQLISESEIIITMLPDGVAVEKVWSEIISFSRPGQYFIDCSTIDVKTSKSVQMQAREKGLLTLDAPVSGGVIGADRGTLTFMVGGASKTYEALDFLLWRWKTQISREWYPYLLRFKHDLQILDKRLSFNRILKTQTHPTQHVLKHRRD